MFEQPQTPPVSVTLSTPPKLTPNQTKIYDALCEARRPMTAYEIIDAVRSYGISAPPTVYRALNKLIQLGLAHRIESLNAFVSCAHTSTHGGNAVFMICDTCGATQEVVDPQLEQLLRVTSGQSDFHMHQATVELRGHCASCTTHAHGDA